MNIIASGLTIAVLVMMTGSSEASAQTTRADSIVDFVETFLSGFMFSDGDRPTIRVADLPSRRPRGLEIPAAASIAGSVEFSSLSFTILRSDDPAETLNTLRRTLEAAGWAIHRPESDTRLEEPGESHTYCRDNQLVGVATQGDGRVSLVFMNDEQTSPCSMPDRVQDERFTMPIPELEPPPGVRPRGGNSSGSADRWSRSVELSGEMSLDVIAAYYVEQLRAHGADVGSTIETETIRLAEIRLADRYASSWMGTLTVMGDTGSDERHVQLYMVRQETR